MKVQAHLGRRTEIWKTLRLLEVRLAALDDVPDRDLYELADRGECAATGTGLHN